jgi:aerobic C4-dicarboxylate transport protein
MTTSSHRTLYLQVLIAIALGIAFGVFFPTIAANMKPLADAFIKLIRLLIAPIIFLTIVTGIASMKDLKEVGRIGVKALLYFEVVTTLALVLGLLVGNFFQPGAGLNIDPHTLNTKAIAQYTSTGGHFDFIQFLLAIIPETFIGAFTQTNLLPVLLVAVLFGFGVLHGGDKTKPILSLFEQLSVILFSIVGFIMRLAPIGAFGAMAYTVGTYGLHTLIALGRLTAAVYITSLLFVVFVLGAIAKASGFSLWRFLKYIREELLIVLGTSSSEAVLPRMFSKLEALGCGKTVVGLVLPAGYTFNLDGTSIYLTLATLFIAQALNIPLSLGEQLLILSVLILTSKGAAAISGGGFIVLAATLSSLHTLPVEGLVILLGVDKFLSEARAMTNLIGNGVATIVLAKWEGDYDNEAAKKILG